MRFPVSQYSTVELAHATGHKLTNIHRAMFGGVPGQMVFIGKLDNGPLQRLTVIRQQLERELLEAEGRQGKPVTMR